MNQIEARPSNAPLNWRNIVIIIFLAAAAYLLLTEHRSHVLNVLPYVLLLACPFVHFFMHRGHGRDGKDAHSGRGCH